MYLMYLEGSQTISLEEKRLEIDYYLIESTQFNANQTMKIYGIKIINKILEEKGICYEVESVLKISYSKTLVQRLLAQLIKHMVTPVCLFEAIDELMSNELIEELSS